MNSVQLIFGTCNHQPEGSVHSQFESAYQESYKPFLTTLNSFPDFPVVLHYSGSLLKWIQKNHPEFFMLLEEMVHRKQVELLGGGFYNPILSMIPNADKIGQMEMLTTFLRTNFGNRPRGCLLSGQVWEPGLALILDSSGMEYTFLADRYFLIAGLEEKELFLPYLTEDQGKVVSVFPLSIDLGRLIATYRSVEIIDYLKDAADTTGRRVASILIDGNKFTHNNEKWLIGFIEAVKKNSGWLIPVTSRKYMRNNRPEGKIYFPCLADEEIMARALDRKREKQYLKIKEKIRKYPAGNIFLHGGIFRQFMTRYPEIDLLYARMIYTHLLVNQVRGDKYKKKSARDELWKGQAGCVFWNSPAGGIYANHLRKAAYRAFLEAEKITRVPEMFIPAIISVDFDMDGDKEFLYQGKMMNAYIHKRGGSLFALDFLPVYWNYLDTLSRWPESYHENRQQGCDWYPRRSFLDHFFTQDTTIASFDTMDYQEAGDFLCSSYELVENRKEPPGITLRFEGSVKQGRSRYALALEKRFVFSETGVEVYIKLINISPEKLKLWYGSEINLALASMDLASMRIFGVKDKEKHEITADNKSRDRVDSLVIRDLINKVAIILSSDRKLEIWSLPVVTTSQAEGSMKKIYQSSCFICHWQLELDSQDSWETNLSLKLQKKKSAL